MKQLLYEQETTPITANCVFDDTDEYAEGGYGELSALYDAQTIRHLEGTAVAG